MALTGDIVTSGNSSIGGSVYEPWPNYWAWPTYVYPTTTIYTGVEQEYANAMEVEHGEHDVTLHFYRSSGPGKGRSLVKTVTIPRGLFEWMQAKEA